MSRYVPVGMGLMSRGSRGFGAARSGGSRFSGCSCSGVGPRVVGDRVARVVPGGMLVLFAWSGWVASAWRSPASELRVAAGCSLRQHQRALGGVVVEPLVMEHAAVWRHAVDAPSVRFR